tara:strand:- start:6208 stop:6522 length:315 start_codon:yes stop_codon:yes gene_type:complete
LVRAIFDGVAVVVMKMWCGGWLRLLGGEAVWWMRDGERRAGEVFKIWGAGGSLENQTKARSESAGTSKAILLATRSRNVKLASEGSRAPLARYARRRNRKSHGC